jgi:hypothetical protein
MIQAGVTPEFADIDKNMQEHPFPEATYHDNYSDEENDGDRASEASSAGDEDEDEDDFVTKPREDSGPSNKKRRLSQRDDPPASSNITVSTVAPASTSAALPQPLPGLILEPSIINAEPLDEFIREIADWILRFASGRNNIEVSLLELHLLFCYIKPTDLCEGRGQDWHSDRFSHWNAFESPSPVRNKSVEVF